MTYYRTTTKVTSDGKIILPEEWRALFAHEVELTLKDLEQPKVAAQNPVALLDNLIQLYNNEEADIDISEIYLNREKGMSEKLALLDTDTLIEILREKYPVSQKGRDYLTRQGNYNISILTYYECLRGYKTIGATRKLLVFQSLLTFTNVIQLDYNVLNRASEIYAFLKPRGLLRGEFDLLIGTTALINDLKLVTNNVRHYEPLKIHFGLEVENWV